MITIAKQIIPIKTIAAPASAILNQNRSSSRMKTFAFCGVMPSSYLGLSKKKITERNGEIAMIVPIPMRIIVTRRSIAYPFLSFHFALSRFCRAAEPFVVLPYGLDFARSFFPCFIGIGSFELDELYCAVHKRTNLII